MEHSNHKLMSAASSNTHSMPGMDHSGDMPMCKMNMIFTWDYTNLCVIFKWWHIQSLSGFIFSLALIVGLGVGYEYVRAKVKFLENKQLTSEYTALPTSSPSEQYQSVSPQSQSSLQLPILTPLQTDASRVSKAVTYGVLVGYSYMLMLVFMTYNGWVMLAVVVGAALGNYLFNTGFNDSMACH